MSENITEGLNKENVENGKQPPNEWTIMIYMAGDNNLSDDMITSINQLKAVTHHSRGHYKANITFIIDFDSQHPAAPKQRYIIGKSHQPEPKPLPENDNTGESINELIKFGVKDYEAENYALVISAHTDAFQGKTLLVDEDPPGIMTLKKLKKAITEGIKGSDKGKLDILAFEGCVMNTLEVMYEFKDIADIWIGSQGSIPNYAWDYYNIGHELISQTGSVTSKQIYTTIIDKVRDYHKEYAFDGRSVDISAIDLREIDGLVVELENWMTLLNLSLTLPFLDFIFNSNFDFLKHPIIRMFLSTHWKSQTFMRDQSIDLRDFNDILGKLCEDVADDMKGMVNDSEDCLKCLPKVTHKFLKCLANKSDSLSAYIDNKKIVLDGATTGLEYHFANGISLFFPWTILSYLISSRNYSAPNRVTSKDGLEFLEQNSGKLWLNFLRYFLILTERPKGELGDADLNKIRETLIKLLTILMSILSNGNLPDVSTFTIKLEQESLKLTESEKETFSLEKIIEQIFCMLLEIIEKLDINLCQILEYISLVEILEYKQSEEFRDLLLKDAAGETRDDHIKTRNGLDARAYYFGRYRNLRVKDLSMGPRNFGTG